MQEFNLTSSHPKYPVKRTESPSSYKTLVFDDHLYVAIKIRSVEINLIFIIGSVAEWLGEGPQDLLQ